MRPARPSKTTLAAAAAAFAVLTAAADAADPATIDAAKAEGELVWYTSQIIDQLARPMAAAFEAKYGITVLPVRANAADLALKVVTEAEAGQVQADVVDGTHTVPALERKDLILKWLPDNAGELPPEFVDPRGFWVATNLYVMTPAYNTELVPPGSEPKTYEDLLDPKWQGQMVWGSSPSTSSAPGFIGNVIALMGEDKAAEYLDKLAAQDIAPLQVSARQTLDQVIAGEYAIALQIFNNHAVISAEQGAPVDWIPMQPATGVPSVVAVTAGAQHPNAAKLFVEFLISEEGQQIFRDAKYIPVRDGVDPVDPKLKPDGKTFVAHILTPEEVDGNMPHWVDIFREKFR